MKVFNTIKTKLVLPPFGMFLIIGILAVVVGGSFFKLTLKKHSDEALSTQCENINYEIVNSLIKIKQETDFVASLNSTKIFIKEAYNADSNTLSEINKITNFCNNDNYNIFYISSTKKIINKHNIDIISQIEVIQNNNTYIKNINNTPYIISNNIIENDGILTGFIILVKNLNPVIVNLHLPPQIGFIVSDTNSNNTLVKYNTNGIKTSSFKPDSSSYFINNYIIRVFRTNTTEKIQQYKISAIYNLNDETALIKKMLTSLLSFFLFTFLIGGIIYYWGITKTIVNPILLINNTIQSMSKGKNTDYLNTKAKNDELGQIINSTNVLIKNQKDIIKFAKSIGSGNLDVSFSEKHEDDILSKSLMEMRQKLKLAKEEDNKRREKEKNQNFINNGISELNNILNQHNNINDITKSSIKFIVDYIDAVVGGFYVLNDDDETDIFYELLAIVAYGRNKLADKKIRIGDGLVGRCVFEKQYILLTEIPQDYMDITSGLGTTNPDSILLVPVILNDTVYGVIELASFIIFEEHIIQFVEKASSHIASVIFNLKTTQNTSKLLNKSITQREELIAQEEEMRQNLEELQATQEEQQRLQDSAIIKEKLLMSVINNISCGVLLIDNKGFIKMINNELCNIIEYSEQDLINQPISTILSKEPNFKKSSTNNKFKTTINNKHGNSMLVNVKTTLLNNDNYILEITTI